MKKLDLNKTKEDLSLKWPWKDNSVEEASAINLLQYLGIEARIHFVNELYRVLKVGGKASLQVPYWCSNRYFRDITVAYPPVVEGWFYDLNAEIRKTSLPKETRYTCDFELPNLGYGMHPQIITRNQEYQQHALTFWKEAAQDLVATLIKR